MSSNSDIQNLRKLLLGVGLTDTETERSIGMMLGEFNIASVAALRAKVDIDSDFELADVGIPSSKRKAMKEALAPKLNFTHWEITVAEDLSTLAYKECGVGTDEHADFEKAYRQYLLQHGLCPFTSQKYVIAICEDPEGNKALFHAYAGSHCSKDWQDNFNFCPTGLTGDVCGQAHSGFYSRAVITKFEALLRLSYEYDCTDIVFCGHSLGGAVSHLSCLMALTTMRFQENGVRAKSVAFGAPFVGLEDVHLNVQLHEWTDNFLTFVNDSDPVPRLLNLVQLLPQLMQDSAGLIHNFGSLMKGLHSAVQTIIPAAAGCAKVKLEGASACLSLLSNALDTLSKSAKVENLIARLLPAFSPIGRYIIVIKSCEGLRFTSLCDAHEILEKLGPARVLQEHVSCAGIICYKHLINHLMPQYKLTLSHKTAIEFFHKNCSRSIASEQSNISDFFCTVRSFSGDSDKGSPQSRRSNNRPHSFFVDADRRWGEFRRANKGSLEVTIEKAVCCFQNSERKRIFIINGSNLDFVHIDGFITSSHDLREETLKIREQSIVKRCDSMLVVQQRLALGDNDVSPKRGSYNMIPSDLQLKLLSDMGSEKVWTIPKDCFISEHVDECAPSHVLLFDLNFFQKVLRFVWLKHHYGFTGATISTVVLLGKMEECLNSDEDFPHELCEGDLADFDKEASLDRVGQDKKRLDLMQAIPEWMAPKNGIPLYTVSQIGKRLALGVATTLVTSVLLWYGIGISALFCSSGALTGGFGTSGLVVSCFGYLGYQLHSYMYAEQYDNVLMQLLRYAGATVVAHPQLILYTEYQKEQHLLNVVDSNMMTKQREFDGSLFEALIESSKKKLTNRVTAIRLIHSMKKQSHANIVAVAGPQNAGKTTLISQMLMDPDSGTTGYSLEGRTSKIALHKLQITGASEEGAEEETSINEQMPALLLDSPGLTSADQNLMRQFSCSGCLVGNVFIYIRTWQGVEDKTDVDAVVEMLSSCSEKSPYLMICLNKIVGNRKDACGTPVCRAKLLQIADGFKHEVKARYGQYVAREANGIDEVFASSSSGARFRSYFDAEARNKIQNVTVKMVELGRPLHEVDEDIRDEVFDAKKIMKWAVKCLAAESPVASHLQALAERVDYGLWQFLVKDLQQQRKREEEKEKEDQMRAMVLASSP